MIRKFEDKAARYRLIAKAELSWHKGNAKPYFSLTGDGMDRGSEFGGCCHDDILKHWPDLQPLVDLHLSDIDGVPMHAEANGWYNLAGALGGLGEAYHAGNSKRNMLCAPPANAPWRDTEYREPTQEECVQLFANYIRLPLVEAQAFIATLDVPPMPLGNAAILTVRHNAKQVRKAWAAFCEQQKPRWLAEANDAIARFALERPTAPK